MIFACRCGAAKTIAPFVHEHLCQGAEAGIKNAVDGLYDEFPVSRLLCAQVRWSLQQLFGLLIGEWPKHPLVCLESKLWVLPKLSSQFDETFGRESAARFVGRMIAPDPQ